MPLGEMLDLEKLAKVCREKGRWFFFFSSAPANCPGMYMTCSFDYAGFIDYVTGGVSSHVNGNAIF